MAFLIDHATRIVVQGLTGSSGRMGAGMMQAGGATIVAGVTPSPRASCSSTSWTKRNEPR